MKLKPTLKKTLIIVACVTAFFSASSQGTVDVGQTGFDVKRPVFAAACEQGCPWGEIGDFVKDAMKPLGYEVILCRNCNRNLGPGIVSRAEFPPELDHENVSSGIYRFDAPIDFGVTASDFLTRAYNGVMDWSNEGPYKNLRLIAKIEDPIYLLVAATKESGITDLAQIVDENRAVRILYSGSPYIQPMMDYYGLTRDKIEELGGSMSNAMSAHGDVDFDVIISDLASPANNPESSHWLGASQNTDLYFMQLPEELLDEMASDDDVFRVTAKWGLLRGVDREIETIARSGESVFTREDISDEAAYDVAKAIDEHRGDLKWYIRPYSYDSRTVWKNSNVPLHPGAEKYYREVGYISDDQ